MSTFVKGKHTDLVVLNIKPHQVAADDEFADIQVNLTLFDGEPIYE